MNISPNSGSINSNSSTNITINLGADDIQPNEQKSGQIHIHSNDFFNSCILLDINVNFTVSINENKEIGYTINKPSSLLPIWILILIELILIFMYVVFFILYKKQIEDEKDDKLCMY